MQRPKEMQGAQHLKNYFLIVLCFLLQAQSAFPQPLEGGVEVKVPERRPYQGGAVKTQTDALCESYAAKAEENGNRLHVMPKAGVGGKSVCLPPDPTLLLIGEDREYCCYSQRRSYPLEGELSWPEEPAWREPTPSNYPPGWRPDRRRPVPDNFPTTPPRENPTYLAGVKEGLHDCGESAKILFQAFESMSRGDFVTAANLLGATDSSAGLRALWKEIAETQVIDETGRKLTPYEVGRRQAQRLCLYVLLPQAGKCVVKGTKCVIGAASKACEKISKRISQLRPFKLKLKTKAPPAALLRGIPLADENYLRKLANLDGLIFIIRDSNPISMRWMGAPGYEPKPLGIKGKTLKPEDLPGVPKAEANKYLGLASAKGLTALEIAALKAKKYTIGSAEEHFLITGPEGQRFYSDIDLHGVYHTNGKKAYTPDLKEKLNCKFVDRAIQHGPHDEWPFRNDPVKAGANYGPQIGDGKSLTVIAPGDQILHLTSLEEMKALYKEIGVDFRKVYPDF